MDLQKISKDDYLVKPSATCLACSPVHLKLMAAPDHSIVVEASSLYFNAQLNFGAMDDASMPADTLAEASDAPVGSSAFDKEASLAACLENFPDNLHPEVISHLASTTNADEFVQALNALPDEQLARLPEDLTDLLVFSIETASASWWVAVRQALIDDLKNQAIH